MTSQGRNGCVGVNAARVMQAAHGLDLCWLDGHHSLCQQLSRASCDRHVMHDLTVDLVAIMIAGLSCLRIGTSLSQAQDLPS